MTTYATLEQFKTADRRIRKALSRITGQIFLQHVMSSLDYFHTLSNRNIVVVNDLLDTATAGRLGRDKVARWLQPVVGHTLGKDAGGRVSFKGKQKGFDYDSINFSEHFSQFPDWTFWKNNPDEPEFDAEKVCQQMIKRLRKQAEQASDAGFSELAQQFGAIAEGIRMREYAMTTPDKPRTADGVAPHNGLQGLGLAS